MHIDVYYIWCVCLDICKIDHTWLLLEHVHRCMVFAWCVPRNWLGNRRNWTDVPWLWLVWWYFRTYSLLSLQNCTSFMLCQYPSIYLPVINLCIYLCIHLPINISTYQSMFPIFPTPKTGKPRLVAMISWSTALPPRFDPSIRTYQVTLNAEPVIEGTRWRKGKWPKTKEFTTRHI